MIVATRRELAEHTAAASHSTKRRQNTKRKKASTEETAARGPKKRVRVRKRGGRRYPASPSCTTRWHRLLSSFVSHSVYTNTHRHPHVAKQAPILDDAFFIASTHRGVVPHSHRTPIAPRTHVTSPPVQPFHHHSEADRS